MDQICTVSLDFFWLLLSPLYFVLLFPIFLAAGSYKPFSSPQRAHVTSFVKRDKLELAFWLLCSMHAVIQVPLDWVVGSHNCRCHPFAACIVDVNLCFNWQTVSALTSGFSHYFAQPTPYWLHLAYLVKWLAVGIIPATTIPKRLLRLHEICLSFKYFPSINFPAFCLSMKSATHVP